MGKQDAGVCAARWPQTEAADQAKDRFLLMVAHELRTPANAILGWVRLLRSGAFDAADAEHALGTIERNARLQMQLIEDLLDLSRIGAGKLRFHPRP